MVRLSLYNKDLFCGNQAIQWEMNDMEVQPIPSLSTIGRILRRRELTHRRIGRYSPKGKKYPELPSREPNQTHQVTMASTLQLKEESLAFEHRNNSTYRYSKIEGKTSLKVLASMEKKLVFPSKGDAPKYPLDKPEEGCYHLVRFIRSDCRLNIFSEMFSASPETQYEYVVATVNVKEQKLKLYLDTIQVEEYQYRLR
jgi:hypothetical protein